MPKDQKVHIARGIIYQDMDKHQLAINDFNEAINIDSTNAEAFYRRGISQLKSHNSEQAIEDFKQSLELVTESVKNPGIYDGLGSCYHALRDYEKALNYFNTAVEKDQTNTQFLINRAQCFSDQKLYAE